MIFQTYPFLSRILFGGGLLLLYYATLRLHFFTEHPLLTNKPVALILLLAIVAGHFYFASQRRSEFLTGMAVFLGNVTALAGDTTHLTLPLVAITAAVAVYLFMPRFLRCPICCARRTRSQTRRKFY